MGSDEADRHHSNSAKLLLLLHPPTHSIQLIWRNLFCAVMGLEKSLQSFTVCGAVSELIGTKGVVIPGPWLHGEKQRKGFLYNFSDLFAFPFVGRFQKSQFSFIRCCLQSETVFKEQESPLSIGCAYGTTTYLEQCSRTIKFYGKEWSITQNRLWCLIGT